MNWKDKVDKDFYTSQECLTDRAGTDDGRSDQNAVLTYLLRRPRGGILDVGERSPLTALVEKQNNYPVDNTDGDLDVKFTAPQDNYFTILMSHVIEHLFNPLYCLLELRKLLYEHGRLIIATPWCSTNFKLGFSDIHYHEIDEYRMGKLLKRAGFVIINTKYYTRPGGGFHGIRPIIKKFTQQNVIYECVKIREGV